MFSEFLALLKEYIKKIPSSRLLILGAACIAMYAGLIHKLYNLQIINGEQALNDYMQITEQTLTTAGTRGNIYDRNGKVLAYNKLAYSVTIQDIGAYATQEDRNAMYLRLVRILENHGEKVQGKFEVAIDGNGDMAYTSATETARKRFLCDYYGLKKVDELDDDKNLYPSQITARELFERARKDGKLIEDSNGNPIAMTDQEALDIINIQYAQRFIAFRKYEATTVAVQISDETMADILEHTAQLEGVNVEESTIRAYHDSIAFASIIGYTGKVQEEKLEELKKERSDYDINDIVGTTGIEASMEQELQGAKGSKTIYKDSRGRIRETLNETEAKAGNDVYLSQDADLQVGIYHLVEQSLAGVLLHKIESTDARPAKSTDGSSMMIPVKDAYFQLINNNVLSLNHFEAEDASNVEKGIYSKFSSSREQIFTQLQNELLSSHPTPMKDLSEDTAAYMYYIYTYLSDPTVGIVKKDLIDTASAEYKAWKADEISLREYLYYGISKGWVDSSKSKLGGESKYSSADDAFKTLVDYVIEKLKNDSSFTKKIYRYLINSDVVTGQELCLALFDQGVIAYNDEDAAKLKATGDAYSFLMKKISTLEITPAQLALAPCNAGVVVTDIKTGQVLALVSYPGYDNNQIGDRSYLSQLQNDLSLPLYNNATQTKKAPGSSFKPVTAVAALEEKVIGINDTINCTGYYDAIASPIKCWIYPGHHGPLNMVGALQNSCNFFFDELGHRLSMDGDGSYLPSLGLEKLRKYASMFGLDHKSGVEIDELDPQISNIDPERSAMGQGNHAYANVQLSRYVAAIASRGNVFELSLLDKTTDSEGNLIKDYTPEISSHIDAADSTWDTVQQGMREVIASGTAKKLFADLQVPIAGKTGTAQEASNKANHAFFISYAPYDNPEICVTVNIPYGYSASNAANIAKYVYQYYYGHMDLESIMKAGARDATNITIRD